MLYTLGEISSVYGEHLMYVNVLVPSKEEDLRPIP
jgi:hypothetical protein